MNVNSLIPQCVTDMDYNVLIRQDRTVADANVDFNWIRRVDNAQVSVDVNASNN
jgi:hypothetical protein